GWHARGLIESGLTQQPEGQITTLGNAAVFRCDGGLANPVLEAAHGLVVALGDFLADRFQFILSRGRRMGPSQSRLDGGRVFEKSAATHVLLKPYSTSTWQPKNRIDTPRQNEKPLQPLWTPTKISSRRAAAAILAQRWWRRSRPTTRRRLAR